jgi:hypothetical protein
MKKSAEAVKISDAKTTVSIASATKMATARSTAKKPDEWTIRLDAAQSPDLNSLCESRMVIEKFKSVEEVASAAVTNTCYDAFVDKFITDGCRPANPTVVSSDGEQSCLFIFQDKYKINIDPPATDDQHDPEWGASQAVTALKAAGLSSAKAVKFVENEVDVVIPTFFMTIQEMIDGHMGSGRKRIPPTSASRSAGTKMLEFLSWRGKGTITPLTNEEQSAITYKKLEWHLKPGMLDRICLYAKTADDLRAIFKVFTPVLGFRSTEVGATLSEKDRNAQLQKTFTRTFPA